MAIIFVITNNSVCTKKQTDTFTDTRDGKVYKTVKIGNQVWFAENLAFKPDSGYWAYNNDSNNVEIYGYLYNWKTAINVCPTGWHLPSDDEWKILETYLGINKDEIDKTGWRSNTIGDTLKSTTGWQIDGNGNNGTGFNALPGGFCTWNSNFYSVKAHGDWWTATQYDEKEAWYRELTYIKAVVSRSYLFKTNGFSVRCVQDN